MPRPYQAKKCLVCGKDLNQDRSLYQLFAPAGHLLCSQCKSSFVENKKPALYSYNEFFRSLLFAYKGLGDLALAPVFLDGRILELKRRYRGYIILFPPSSEADNIRRGFFHLPWIFKDLDLEMAAPFVKRYPYKQSTSKHREDIYQVIILKEKPDIYHRKVLLADDVITSGHTLECCRRLLEPYEPAVIEKLALAGTLKKKGK